MVTVRVRVMLMVRLRVRVRMRMSVRVMVRVRMRVIKQQLMLDCKEGVSQPFQQGPRCSIPTHMQIIRRSQMVLNVAASFKTLLGAFTPRMSGREKIPGSKRVASVIGK